MMRTTLSAVIAVALAGALAGAALPAPAQQAEATQEGQAATQAENEAAESAAADDVLIARVGDAEIRRSDVMDAIRALPMRMQQTPPQVLYPAVIEQLVMDRLIADRARAQNLAEDPEVQALVEREKAEIGNRAMASVWMRRELDRRVTDADVENALEKILASNPELKENPDLATQVRQALQVQAMAGLAGELRGDSRVTFYGPDGKPIETGGAAAAGGATGETQAAASGEGAASGAAAATAEAGNAGAPALTLQVATSEPHGDYLAGADGRPLYIFEPDTRGAEGTAPASACEDACAEAWPPALAGTVDAGDGAEAGLAGTFERAGGQSQATYNGWPLYTFAEDMPGQPPAGQEKEAFGGEWYLIRPDGTRVEG